METKTETKETMRCSCCNTVNWENVDKFRVKPAGMAVCKECGFISYPSKWKSPEEIKKFYRSSYRNPPSVHNLFAGERKNHFHHKFLLDTFEAWKAKGLENPKILEIGAAFGMTLNWIKYIFPKADISGTELTTSMRRNAYHEFGIKLTEDIDESKKYDLIITYKVLEHQLDPDKELERYTRLLSPEGLLYISVPTWFNTMTNFGMGGFDLEYYYDPSHINVWTRETFENILARSGFEIIKDDQVIYSSTYLCKPNPEKKSTPILKHDYKQIIETLQRIIKAYLAFTDNKYDTAIQLWPNYPQAHVSKAEVNRKLLTDKGWEAFKEAIIQPALDACPTSTEVVVMATDFALRAEKFQEAVQFAEQGLAMKPENPVSLHQLTNIMREMALKAKNQKERLHYFNEARKVCRHLRFVSTQHFKEATDLIYSFNAELPFMEETGTPAVAKDAPPVAQNKGDRPLEAAV